MAGSSSITLFEKSSPHHSLYIIILLFPLHMKDWNKSSIVEARGEGPELCWADFKFLNKDQHIQITLIDHSPMGRHLVFSSLLPRREDSIPSWSQCYHHNNFQMESKFQNFSEELYRYGSMIVWRTRLYLAAYGKYSGGVKGRTRWTVDLESGPDQRLRRISGNEAAQKIIIRRVGRGKPSWFYLWMCGASRGTSG
jgi:hypothetical protein